MSYNVTGTITIRSTLRISEANWRMAKKLELPALSPIYNLADMDFGPDGYASIPRFRWSGEGSGFATLDGTDPHLAAFIKLTEGEADVIFVWEGGDSFSGARFRDGKYAPAEVKFSLADEE